MCVWPTGFLLSGRRWYDRRHAGPGIRPSAADDRSSRHLRARLFAEPRPEHGYCTDDMARVLVVATREPDAERQLNGLAGVAVRFLNEAQASPALAATGWTAPAGGPTSRPGGRWGRCIWGLGTAAAHSDVSLVRKSAVIQFERAAQARSKSPRAMAFAALGAAELLTVDPEHRAARKLITDYAGVDRRTQRRSGLAVARAATHLRERGACPRR